MSSQSTSSSITELAGQMHAPPHPGELVAETVEHLQLSVTTAATELGVTRQTLHRVIAGRVAITPEMALRLGRWAGNGPGLWLRMQQAHDLWQARARLGDVLMTIPDRASSSA